MAIIQLPLTNQLTNGQTADGGQVLADLNAIASQVNANCAANGVNNDITALNALLSVAANVTATGWILYASAINNSQITGSTIDVTTTGVTQPVGTNDNTLATTALVAQTAFSAALPAQLGAGNALLTTNGTTAAWAADQTNNSGKNLTTNGSALSWAFPVGQQIYMNATQGGF